MNMPEKDREEIKEMVADVVQSTINQIIVKALVWIVGFLALNAGIGATGVWMFWDVNQRARMAVSDRWTGSMELMSEYDRRNLNAAYIPVDVRKIQEKYPPQ